MLEWNTSSFECGEAPCSELHEVANSWCVTSWFIGACRTLCGASNPCPILLQVAASRARGEGWISCRLKAFGGRAQERGCEF